MTAPKVRFRVSPDHRLGTRELPYRLDDTDAARRAALAATATARAATLGRRAAAVSIKRRLHALRIYRKHKPFACDVIERDMRWVDLTYQTGGVTNPVCATPAAIRARVPFRLQARLTPVGPGASAAEHETYLRSAHLVDFFRRFLAPAWCDVDRRDLPSVRLDDDAVTRVRRNRARGTFDVRLRGRYVRASPINPLAYWKEAFACLRRAAASGATGTRVGRDGGCMGAAQPCVEYALTGLTVYLE